LQDRKPKGTHEDHYKLAKSGRQKTFTRFAGSMQVGYFSYEILCCPSKAQIKQQAAPEALLRQRASKSTGQGKTIIRQG